jgi:integrase
LAILARQGLPHVRFHDLRHAHATFMLMQGVHPKVVSERLASIGITLDNYSHVLPIMQEQAARAFDELFRSAQEAPHDEDPSTSRAR